MAFIGYLFSMTDDTGIFQHSVYGVPDPRKGYTTDDNARALILATTLYECLKDKDYLFLAYKYLSFLLNAQKEDGSFQNIMDYNREFREEEASEDCFGRCIWALGRTSASFSIPTNIKRACQEMLKRALLDFPELTSPRAKANVIIGLSYLEETAGTTKLIDKLSKSLTEQYHRFKDGDWHWFEDSVTYGNAALPWSLLRAYQILKKDSLLDTAKESTSFLSDLTLKGSCFKPVGCNGWFMKGGDPAVYDEQPLEACEMILLYTELYEITKEKIYLEHAAACFRWYSGSNISGLSLIDEQTGACYDGITKTGLNYNQGSESIVSYGMAFLGMSKYPNICDG